MTPAGLARPGTPTSGVGVGAAAPTLFAGVVSAEANAVLTSDSNIQSGLNTLLSNAASSGNMVVQLSAGTYAVQGSVNVPANVTLRGAGIGRTTLTFTGSPTTSNGAIRLTGAGAAVEDLTVNVTAGDYWRPVDLRTSGSAARRVKVNVTSADLTQIARCFYPVSPSGTTTNVQVIDCEATGSVPSGSQLEGLESYNTTNLVVRNLYVHDIDAPSNTRQRWAIYIGDNCTGAIVEACRIVDVDAGGIQNNSGDSTGTRDLDYGRKVTGNTVKGCAYTGISTIYCWGAAVTGNTVSECETLCIVDLSSKGCTVVGNTFKQATDNSGVANTSPNDSDRPMVIVGATVTGCVVEGNVFDDRGTALVGLAVDGDDNMIGPNVFGTKAPRRNLVCRTGSERNDISGGRYGTDDTTSISLVELFGNDNRIVGGRVRVPTGGTGVRLGGTRTHMTDTAVTCDATATNAVYVTGTDCQVDGRYISGTYTNMINDGGTRTITRDPHNSYVELVELAADPSAPTTDRARMYAKDNGSGKTGVYVRFNTGAVQNPAIQP